MEKKFIREVGRVNREQARRIRKSQGNPAEFFMKTFRKTIPDFFQRVDSFADPRNQSYITYPQSVMVGTVLLKNICGITDVIYYSCNTRGLMI